MIYYVKLMTYDSQTEENNFYDRFIITKNVLNVTLTFLRCGIERKRASYYDVN